MNSPLIFNFLSLGAHTFSVRAIDDGGLEDPTPATRSWTVTSGGPSPKSLSTSFTTGAAVPGTGGTGALRANAALAASERVNAPADAVLTRLSNPAIDEEGNVVFSAKWTSASGGKGKGIFTPFGSIAEVGGSVPGVDGATFVTLGAPVIEGGYVVFLATLTSASVPKAAVLSDAPTGTLAVVARAGDVAPGADGAKFKSFESVAVSGSGVAFLGKLKIGSGSPAVTEANDLGVWAMDASHSLTLLLREGQMVGGRKIKTLAAFMAGNGSPGQGRGWLRVIAGEAPQVLALAFLSGKTQAVLSADLDGVVTTLSQTSADFTSYGVPAANAQGYSAFRASLATGASGIFLRNPADALYTGLVRTGDPAGTTGAKFTLLKDPVLASDGGVAFPATIKGGSVTGIAKRTLWWQPPSGTLTLLAQGGAEAAELPGAQWESFTSLAIARDRGPIFVATLVVGAGGVTQDNATGVWATDSTGKLKLLFRTGDVIDGKTVQSFKLLEAVPGSVGVTRSFNDRGEVLWLATFTDRTQTIIATTID